MYRFSGNVTYSLKVHSLQALAAAFTDSKCQYDSLPKVVFHCYRLLVEYLHIEYFETALIYLLDTGNLYFANVLPDDTSEHGSRYICASFNSVMRGNVQGDDQLVKPVHSAGIVTTDRCIVAPPPPIRVT